MTVLRRLMKQLATECQIIANFSLQQSSTKPIVLIPQSRIMPVTAAAISRPLAKILL